MPRSSPYDFGASTAADTPREPTAQRVLPRPDAARYLGISSRQLERYATDGGGPPYVRLSVNRVGYTIEALDAWLRARTFSSTSEEAARGSRAA